MRVKCPKCQSNEIRALIQVGMYIDANDNYHLTKKVISKKSTEIWYQDHNKTSYTCVKCCYAWGPLYSVLNVKPKNV